MDKSLYYLLIYNTVRYTLGDKPWNFIVKDTLKLNINMSHTEIIDHFDQLETDRKITIQSFEQTKFLYNEKLVDILFKQTSDRHKLNDLNIKDLLFRNNKLLYLSFQDNTLSFDSYIKNNDFINLLHYRLIINPNYMNKL